MHRVEVLRHARQGPFQAWASTDGRVALRRTGRAWHAYLDGRRVADPGSSQADGVRLVRRAPLEGQSPYDVADQLALEHKIHVVFDVV